jgi:hypothetical protein
MRLYPGGTLADRLARRGRLPVSETIDVATKLASALDAAHAIGMLHRDVKPQNVLLTETGEPVLADFGIAGILQPERDSAQTSTSFFTLAHVAPEILQHRRYSVASDVYALASTAYQLLTGRPAFDPDDPRAGALVLDTPPPPITVPDVPAPVAGAVLVAMAKDPADRPVSAGAFAAALTTQAATPTRTAIPTRRSEPGITAVIPPDPAPGAEPRASTPTRVLSGRTALAILAALATVAVVLFAVGLGYRLVARQPPGDPVASSPLRSSSASQTDTGTVPATLPPAMSPTATLSEGSAGVLEPSPSPRTGTAAPTCQQPEGLRRLKGVRAFGRAKPAESYPGAGHVSYAAKNLVDGDTSTAWVEGAPGLGIGSTVRLTFPRTVDVRLGCIVNGYGKSWDVYRRNARVRDLDVVSDAGRESTVLVDAGSADAPAVFQELRVPFGAVDRVDLVIGSAYAAQQVAGKPAYADTCISELEFWYVPGHGD